MDDKTVITKILARDRKALHTFYTTYAPQLTRHIKHRVSDLHDAEDILQDTLYSFLEALRDFEGKSTIQTYLFSICNHKIIDFYRRKKIKHLVFSQVPELEMLISPLSTPEDELDTRLLREKIHAALGKLLPQYRRLLLSKYADNLSLSDIAKKCSVTVKSAESALFRARKAFVKAFISI
jgi:RNA polymerase sigma factor (sigma-70 family)